MPKDGKGSLLGPFSFTQDEKGSRATEDSILLTEFLLSGRASCPQLKEEDSVIDLGTGTAVIPLLLCSKSRVRNIVGVEIDEELAALAKKNVESNGLGKRVKIITADWRSLKDVFPEGSFRVVVSNPPYIKRGCGRISPLKKRALARHECAGTVKDLIEASKHLCGKHGRIFYVYPVKRLKEVVSELTKAGLEPKRIEFVPGKNAARLFLIEAGAI